jgi:hypothetical protein
MFLNESEDIAVFPAGPAAIALPARIDIKGRPLIVMEGTQALKGLAGRTQADIAANDFDYIVGILDLLDHGSPVDGQKGTWLAGKENNVRTESPSHKALSVLTEFPVLTLAREGSFWSACFASCRREPIGRGQSSNQHSKIPQATQATRQAGKTKSSKSC